MIWESVIDNNARKVCYANAGEKKCFCIPSYTTPCIMGRAHRKDLKDPVIERFQDFQLRAQLRWSLPLSVVQPLRDYSCSQV
jgi:hypothetical protein